MKTVEQVLLDTLVKNSGLDIITNPDHVSVLLQNDVDSVPAAYCNTDRTHGAEAKKVLDKVGASKPFILFNYREKVMAKYESTMVKIIIHEFAHATGHKKLLNRYTVNMEGSKRRDIDIAREEVIAETTALEVMLRLGLDTHKIVSACNRYIREYLDLISLYTFDYQGELRYIEQEVSKATEFILKEWLHDLDLSQALPAKAA